MSIQPLSSPRSSQLRTQTSSQCRFENVVFQVEDQLFTVPKWYFVENSSVFRGMFSTPKSPDQSEGVNEDHPLVLAGVKVDDFQALVSLMYPKITYSISGTRKYAHEPESLEERIKYYTSILELSRKWYFHGLHAYAVQQLTDCWDSVDKIIFGKRYNIPEWIIGGFTEIVDRRSIITKEEGERLGWETALGIVALREHCLRLPLAEWGCNPTAVDLPIIQKVFADDISQAESANTNFYENADPASMYTEKLA